VLGPLLGGGEQQLVLGEQPLERDELGVPRRTSAALMASVSQ
jgi:hypothetical protein